MYNTNTILHERLSSRLQTKSNNNDPRPQVHLTRKQTPITTQRFWESIQVTPTVGLRSSIAVRRPEGNLSGDMVFVAQVEDGNAVIRKAESRINLIDMVWSHVTTLNNVSELSIMFDGYMKMVEGKVESHTTGDLPIVFYVDSSNSLKGWNMNTDVTFTISDTAYNVASVRGLYSEAADLNDGIFVFYTNASGELWEARVLNDEVTELTQITLLPTGVTGWVDVWASLTFDYRVVLQLKGNDGNVYTLLAASRPSGYNGHEYVSLTDTKIYGLIGFIPPAYVSIETVGVVDGPLINYGKVVKIVFDRHVYNVSNADTTNIYLIGGYGSQIEKIFYPYKIESGVAPNEILLYFNDINNAVPEIRLVVDSCVMGSQNMPLDNMNTGVVLYNLRPYPRLDEHVEVTEVTTNGELINLLFIDAPTDQGHITISEVVMYGSLYMLYFEDLFTDLGNVCITEAVTYGVLCDINNIPL